MSRHIRPVPKGKRQHLAEDTYESETEGESASSEDEVPCSVAKRKTTPRDRDACFEGSEDEQQEPQEGRQKPLTKSPKVSSPEASDSDSDHDHSGQLLQRLKALNMLDFSDKEEQEEEEDHSAVAHTDRDSSERLEVSMLETTGDDGDCCVESKGRDDCALPSEDEDESDRKEDYQDRAIAFEEVLAISSPRASLPTSEDEAELTRDISKTPGVHPPPGEKPAAKKQQIVAVKEVEPEAKPRRPKQGDHPTAPLSKRGTKEETLLAALFDDLSLTEANQVPTGAIKAVASKSTTSKCEESSEEKESREADTETGDEEEHQSDEEDNTPQYRTSDSADRKSRLERLRKKVAERRRWTPSSRSRRGHDLAEEEAIEVAGKRLRVRGRERRERLRIEKEKQSKKGRKATDFERQRTCTDEEEDEDKENDLMAHKTERSSKLEEKAGASTAPEHPPVSSTKRGTKEDALLATLFYNLYISDRSEDQIEAKPAKKEEPGRRNPQALKDRVFAKEHIIPTKVYSKTSRQKPKDPTTRNENSAQTLPTKGLRSHPEVKSTTSKDNCKPTITVLELGSTDEEDEEIETESGHKSDLESATEDLSNRETESENENESESDSEHGKRERREEKRWEDRIVPRTPPRTAAATTPLSTFATPTTPFTKTKKGALIMSPFQTPYGGKENQDSNGKTPNTAATGNFQKQRRALAEQLFKEYNAKIFDSQLPDDLPISWSIRLTTTAGRTHCKRSGGNQTAAIELSVKVLTDYKRLRNTLCHELCHAAAWLIDNSTKPPHGPLFFKWARKAERIYPDLDIKTCHNYDIECKYKYQCLSCGAVVGRHSKSIDPKKKRCGKCLGTLKLLPKIKKDGTPVASSPNTFALFVKENFASIKKDNPTTPHKDLMRLVSLAYQQRKPHSENASPPLNGGLSRSKPDAEAEAVLQDA